MKRMKKVLSIVLSLAMILTSITVYNTKTAKAAGLFPFKYGQIDRGEFIVGAKKINVVFSWDRNTYPVGKHVKIYPNSKENQMIRTKLMIIFFPNFLMFRPAIRSPMINSK